jgi:hypothetical protein
MLFAPACSEENHVEETKFDCDQGYELVFEADAAWSSADRTYRYWLFENSADFLSGKVLDVESGKEYAAVGQSEGEGAYKVTFTPGQTYLQYVCLKPLSVTIDLKDLAGTLTVYCDLAPFDQSPTEAAVECDNTGVSL